MKNYHYAQIDLETGYVVSDSWLSGAVDAPHMIPIANDFMPLGKMYINGEWLPQPEPEPEAEPDTEVAE